MLLLQQCNPVPVEIYALESDKCGFQPLFRYQNRNFTIGLDGWSMHPFSPCFWPTHFININGKTYSYESDSENSTKVDWKLKEATVHASNLDLISKFDDDVVKNYNFELQRHPAYETNSFEQLNIVADIIGRIQESEDGTLERLTVSEDFIQGLSKTSSMSLTSTLGTVTLSGIVILSGCVFLYLRYRPIQILFRGISQVFCQRKKKADIEMANVVSNLSLQPSAPPNTPQTTNRKMRNHRR